VEPVVKGDVREVHLQMRCQLEPAIDRVERQTHLEQMTTYWNMKVEIKNYKKSCKYGLKGQQTKICISLLASNDGDSEF
jgi:hypothetical protein